MIELSEIQERRWRTATVYFAILALGMCTAIPGPTLLALERLVKAQTSDLTTIYLSRSSGYLIGSFVGGITLDKFKNQHSQIVLFTFTMACSTLGIPFCRELGVLISIMVISGIAMGALDTGANVWLLNVWEDEGSPYFQALHFFFGLGALIAPSIAGIFLPQEEINETTNFQNNNGTNIENMPPVTFAYISVGVVSLFVTLFFASLFLIKITDKEAEKKQYKDPPFFSRVAVLVTIFLLLFVYCGTEIGFAQMIATYAVKSYHRLSQSSASYMTSVFWGTFTIFRGVGIFLALKLSPLAILLCDFLIMISASILLAVFGNTYVICLWIGCGLLGIGLASFYASAVTWVKKYVNISNRIGSSFVIAASLGEMIAPLAISQYVANEPQFLMYFTMSCIIICGLLILIMWILTSRMTEKSLLQFNPTSNPGERNCTAIDSEEKLPINSIQLQESNL